MHTFSLISLVKKHAHFFINLTCFVNRTCWLQFSALQTLTMSSSTNNTDAAVTKVKAKAAKKAAKSAAGAVGKRHNKIQRNNLQRISAPGLRRISRRAGIKRTRATVYGECREVLRSFVDATVSNAIVYCQAAGRKTVTSGDVVMALERQGRPLYGY